MKVEGRGKYAGVKVHLEAEECNQLIEFFKEKSTLSDLTATPKIAPIFSLAGKMGKKITELMKEKPDILKDRTPEQIQAVMVAEAEQATQKLEAFKLGGNWKDIHLKKNI